MQQNIPKRWPPTGNEDPHWTSYLIFTVLPAHSQAQPLAFHQLLETCPETRDCGLGL